MANWIAGAIKKPGSFTATAKRHGESTAELASSVKSHPDKFSATTRRRAALARTLSKIRP